MIRLKTNQDAVEKLEGRYQDLLHYITHGLNDQLALDTETELAECVEYISYFGGHVFLLENAVELKSIDLPSNWGSDQRRSIIDDAEVFDIARYVCKGKYAELMLITNNGGGDIYFIPYEISKRCSNVKLSIRMTIESDHAAANNMKMAEDLGDVRQEDGMDEAKDVQEEMRQASGADDGPDGEDGPWAKGYEGRSDDAADKN
jgi:hypothetical protein